MYELRIREIAEPLEQAETATSIAGRWGRPRSWTRSTAAAAHNLAGLRSDDIVDGRGARPVWALQLHVLRELAQQFAQQVGHAEILREQILAIGTFAPAAPDSTRSRIET